jgi:hypothetical protein
MNIRLLHHMRFAGEINHGELLATSARPSPRHEQPQRQPASRQILPDARHIRTGIGTVSLRKPLEKLSYFDGTRLAAGCARAWRVTVVTPPVELRIELEIMSWVFSTH